MAPRFRLILVDGMPGCGKSSISQFITIQFQKMGLRCQWLGEQTRGRPLLLYWDDRKHRDAEEFVCDIGRHWQALAERLRHSDEIIVAECAVFQGPVLSLLRQGLDEAAVARCVERILEICGSASVAFIYVRSQDPGATLQKAAGRRYDGLIDQWVRRHDSSRFAQARNAMGLSGLQTLVREAQAITDELVKGIVAPLLVLDVTQGLWRDYMAEVGSFLSLPQLEAVPNEYLQRFAGTYQCLKRDGQHVENEGSQRFRIEVEEAGLVARHSPIGWYLENRLIPRCKNVFCVAGWPHDVVFEEDEAGQVQAAYVPTWLGSIERCPKIE